MRFQLISDNVDTMVGMRLAGVPGIIVHEEEELKRELSKAIADENVAIILVTQRLVDMSRDYIYDLKLKLPKPLIVEIPDRHSSGKPKDYITKYVRDSIGIKI